MQRFCRVVLVAAIGLGGCVWQGLSASRTEQFRVTSYSSDAYSGDLGNATTVQDGGVTLHGIVEDPLGALIPKAKLTLINKADGEIREAVSDDAGKFSFENVPPGEYFVKATAKGFDDAQLAISVGPKALPAIKIKMDIIVQEEVTVPRKPNKKERLNKEQAERVLAERNADALNLDDDLLRALPMGNQDLLTRLADFLSPAAQGTGGASIIVDGVETDQLSLPPSVIDEVVINKNPYSAEYRRPGKARIEVITRAGSRRRFHGDAHFSLRNDLLDARNPFALEKPDFDKRFFEGSFSGPLPGKRVEFFLSGVRQVNNQSVIVNARTLAGSFTENVFAPQRLTNMVARVDLHPSQFHGLSIRYYFDEDSERNRGVGGFSLPEQGISTSERRHRIRVSERAVFSASFFNDLRFLFERENQRSGTRTGEPAVEVIGAFTGGPSQTFEANRETTLEIQDIVTYLHGPHTLRFGGGIRPKFLRVLDASNFGGTFEFSGLEQFATGTPFVFRVNQGQPEISFSQHDAYSFFQDEWRLRPNLSLVLGLRYDWQTNIQDLNNLAPRLAFAFAPGQTTVQKTVLRGGIGVFYERFPESVTERRLLFDGLRIRELVISEPTFPNPFGTGDASVRLPSVVRVASDISTPYSLQASLSVERELRPRNYVTVEYLILRGFHLFRSRNINAPQPETGLRPEPSFRNINRVESSARLRSHVLSFSFRSRGGKLFKGMAQYSLARTTDDTKGIFALPANNYDLRPEWGRSDFDQRHRFNLAGTFELPRKCKCRLATIFTAASGVPFDITTGFDDNRDTVANDRPVGVTRNTGQGPGLVRLDFRLTKLFEVRRLFKNNGNTLADDDIEISVDVFNSLNRTNFGRFIGVQKSPFFGMANSALPARTVQLSFKYTF